MDSDNPKPADGIQVAHQNGDSEQFVPGEEKVVMDDVEETAGKLTNTVSLNGDSDSVRRLDEGQNDEDCEGTNAIVGGDCTTVAQVLIQLDVKLSWFSFCVI